MQACLFTYLPLPGGQGMAGYTPAFLDTIVGGLTGGNLLNKGDPPKRSPTATDALLAGHFIETFLMATFHSQSTEGSGQGRFESEKARLIYALEGSSYAFLSIKISGPENRDFGTLELTLPVNCLANFAHPESTALDVSIHSKWRNHMEEIAISTPLLLSGIVQRMPISLADIFMFKIGTYLPLPDATVSKVSLEAQTGSGNKTLCEGRLGALTSSKAFRVSRVVLESEPSYAQLAHTDNLP